MTYQIIAMTKEDYDEAYDLWKRCKGIGLSDADERCAITKFLDQNPGLCYIARQGSKLVGTALTGSDSRRGYLYHLAVDPDRRQIGIGRALVERSLQALKDQGIQKCHIMVYSDNESGLTFWQQIGWKTRPEIGLMSFDLIVEKNESSC